MLRYVRVFKIPGSIPTEAAGSGVMLNHSAAGSVVMMPRGACRQPSSSYYGTTTELFRSSSVVIMNHSTAGSVVMITTELSRNITTELLRNSGYLEASQPRRRVPE